MYLSVQRGIHRSNIGNFYWRMKERNAIGWAMSAAAPRDAVRAHARNDAEGAGNQTQLGECKVRLGHIMGLEPAPIYFTPSRNPTVCDSGVVR
jgi:hypothetical protein